MSSLTDLFQQEIGEFIQDLLDDLDIQEKFENYVQSCPPTFRVRFAPASSAIYYPFSSGGPNNPVVIEN